MKTRSALQLTLIALLTLCITPLFSSEQSSLKAALLHQWTQDDQDYLESTLGITRLNNNSACLQNINHHSLGSDSDTELQEAVRLFVSHDDSSSTPSTNLNRSDSNTSTNPSTIVPIDINVSPKSHCTTTSAFLNQLNRSLNNEWGVKTWVGYLALSTAYGFYAWTDASYMQLTELWSPPDLFFCLIDPDIAQKMYDFAYTKQRFTAFTGKLAYGAIGECLEWVGSLAKRYEVKLNNLPKVIAPNADITAIETDTYTKSRLLLNTLGLVLAGGSALVDAKLYKRYLTRTYDATPSDITFWPIWLSMGLTLDNFNDVLDLTYAGFAKFCKTQTGEIA
jgi:hypothetical protein